MRKIIIILIILFLSEGLQPSVTIQSNFAHPECANSDQLYIISRTQHDVTVGSSTTLYIEEWAKTSNLSEELDTAYIQCYNTSATWYATCNKTDFVDSEADLNKYLTTPTGITYTESIIDGHYCHTLVDSTTSGQGAMQWKYLTANDCEFDNECSFWFYASNLTTATCCAMLIGNLSNNLQLQINNYAGQYRLLHYLSPTTTVLCNLLQNDWYHIRVSQISSVQFKIYLNNILLGAFNSTGPTSISRLYIQQYTATTGSISIDAVDISTSLKYLPNRNQYHRFAVNFINKYVSQYTYNLVILNSAGTEFISPIQTINVSRSDDNTQIVSESLHTTNWEIKDVTLADNITNSWAINVSNYYTERYAAIEDTSVWSLYPTSTYNTGDRIFVQNKTVVDVFGGERIAFVDFTAITPNDHYVGTNLSLFYSSATDPVSIVYSAIDRDHSGLTWNTKGTTDTNTVIGTLPIASNGWHTVTLTDYQPYLVLRNTVQRAGDFSGALFTAYAIESTHYPEPELTIGYIKYNASLDGINLRTNKTEYIGLSKSIIVNRNDIVQVTLNNSEAIACNLLINGSVVKSLTSTGYNTQSWVSDLDYGTTTIELMYAMTATAIADVRAVEVFSATDSLLNITIAPQNDKDCYVTPGLHGVLIYEEGTLVQFSTIQFNATENIIVYSTDDLTTVQIAIFDASYNGLVFTDYIVSVQYIKYYYNVSETLLNNIIYVDQDSSINITIRDRQFSTLIYQNVLVATEFLNIVCNVYSLRIRNNMNKISQITLNSTYTNTILVGEQIALSLPQDNYTLTYSNDASIPTTQSLTINLNQNWPIQLNTTRFSVYFSVFDQQGLGVEYSSLRFYIDNVRRDFGINQVNNPSLITVLDYFNATIYNSSISTHNVTEFNIYAPIYTIILEHNFTNAMYCKITRSDLNFAPFEVAIEPNHPMPYKFLANMHYSVKWYYGNGTLAKSESILLSDNKKLTFGAHTYETPQLTKSDLQSQIFDWVFLVVLMAIVILATVYVGSLSKANNYPKKNDPVMDQIEQRTIHRKQKTWGVRK